METTQENESLGNSTPASIDIKELLKAGTQFGHEKNRWNPKMKEYIFGLKNNIHIIDLEKTIVSMNEAEKFLIDIASKGPLLFVGTKRQARDIVKKYAIESGSYFITYRWLGGLLSNFKMIKKSLAKFVELEDEFEKGVVNRTKFEVNQMKKEWERMNRIYGGIKTMDRYPVAIVMVDCNFEKGAVIEANAAGIPIVSMVDTNSDPTDIDYVIPANDDAIKSINLIISFLSEAVKKGNKGIGVKHNLKDYSDYNIQIIKKVEEVIKEKSLNEDKVGDVTVVKEVKVEKKHLSKKHSGPQKGILEKVKDDAKEKEIEVKKKNVKSVKKVKSIKSTPKK
jgi:small subunit ribosomal protein S2